MKTKKRTFGIVISVAVLVAAIITGVILKSNTNTNAAVINDNGETPISIDNKKPILDRLMAANEKLVILEIVPYKNASVFNMLTGSSKVRETLEKHKAEIYNQFLWNNKKENGNITTVTVQGTASFHHPYTISYNKMTKEYTVNYPNFFLEEFLDGYSNPSAFSYFSENMEVRTVVAGELKEEDLEGVSFIYISSFLEDKEVINFNNFYVNNSTSVKDLTDTGSTPTGAYDADGNEYKSENAGTIWYDCYYKNDAGELEISDMKWDMVLKLMEFIYKGNSYTGDTPIPVVVNYGNPKSKDANIHKLVNLVMKTSNEEGAAYNGVSTYYEDVLAALTTKKSDTEEYTNSYGIVTGAYQYNGENYSDWGNTNVPFFDMKCTESGEFTFNYVYKTSNNGNDSIFSIGKTNVGMLTDNGTAKDREIISGNNYYVTDILRYLLGVDENNDEVIKVLEIEPCQDFLYSDTNNQTTVDRIMELARALHIRSYTRTDGTVAAYNGIADKKIEFKCMTSLQFNGMNEDLISEYDIIYIGDRSGMMNSRIVNGDSENKLADLNGTIRYSSVYKDASLSNRFVTYNDRKLDGYVYLAFGDLIKTEQALLGYLPSDYEKVDATNKGYALYSEPKTTGLKENSRVLFDINVESLWTPLIYNTYKTSGNKAVYTVKKLRNDIGGPVTNPTRYDIELGNARYSYNDFTEKKMKEIREFIDYGNPVIMADDVYNCIKDEYYNKKGGFVYPTSNLYKFVNSYQSSDETMSVLTIFSDLMKAMKSEKLEIKSCTSEYLKGITWTKCPVIEYDSESLVKESSVVEKPEKLRFNATFRATPGNTYRVTLIYDKNTDGKFNDEATTDDNNEVLYSTTIKAESKNQSVQFATPIAANFNGMFSWRVQVNEISGNNVINRAIYDDYTIIRGESKTARVLQILPSGGTITMDLSNNGSFTALMNKAAKIINYEIVVETIYSDEFEQLYTGSNKYTAVEDYDTDKNFLKKGGTVNGKNYGGNYSMVVIGFADTYGKQDISDDNGALSNIIDFAAKGGSVLFTHDTIAFSNNVNYGIYKDSWGNIQTGSSQDITRYGDKMSLDFTRLFRDLAGMDKYSVTTIPNLNSDTLANAHVPTVMDNNGNETYVREIQGLNNWVLYLRSMGRRDNAYYSLDNGAYHRMNNGGRDKNCEVLTTTKNAYSYGLNTILTTNKADQINKGQISLYPYNTTSSDGTIRLATTHGQYYELNMEEDDLVVWYTLSSDRSNYYGDNKGDAATNYYIYSKGNITYSGAGHSTMGEANEHKLFVNTVIKAIAAGNYKPEVEVLNGSRVKGSNSYVIYTSSLDSEIKVEFKATDADLATRETVQTMYSNEADILSHIGRFDKGDVYWIDGNGDERLLIHYQYGTDNILLNGERNTFYICDPYNNDKNTNVKYTDKAVMKECYDTYVKAGTVKLKFVAIDSKGEFGSADATILNHDLFDLD